MGVAVALDDVWVEGDETTLLLLEIEKTESVVDVLETDELETEEETVDELLETDDTLLDAIEELVKDDDERELEY